VTCALLGGASTGAIVSPFTLIAASVLLGWDTAVVIFLGWVWSAVWRLSQIVTCAQLRRTGRTLHAVLPDAA
jgi:hypothetical protein